MNYFANFQTVEQIKAEYKRLAVQNHPDRGGDAEVMKEINNQYTAALEKRNGQTSKDGDREFTYKYDHAIELEIMEMIQKIITAIGDVEDIDLILIGRWIWILGNTKPVKEPLKELSCKWHRDRACWFWRSADDRGYGRGGDLESLAHKYGAADFSKKAGKRKKISA